MGSIQYTMAKKQQKQSKAKPRSRKVRTAVRKVQGDQAQFAITQLTQQMVRVRGHEILGNVNSITSDGAINIGGIFDLNPCGWSTSRLAGIAKGYEKYRYNTFRVTYISRVASITSGLVSVSAEFDYNDPIVSGDTGLLIASQSGVFTQAAVRSSCTTSWRRPAEDKEWYLASMAPNDMTVGNTSQGRIYALCGASVTGVVGSIVIEYDLDLYQPELEPLMPVPQYLSGTANDTTAEVANAAYKFAIAGFNPTNTASLVEAVPTAITYGGTAAQSAALQEGTTGSSNRYDLAVGKTFYIAWNLVTGLWNAYATLVDAEALANPLANRTGASAAALLVSVAARALKY